MCVCICFFFKQKTAYEMRISDWSSDVCSSDLTAGRANVSRAVSDLVRAGMLHRHYQGYRVDHYNRGARRQAVYTLSRVARELLQTATVGRSTSGTPGEDSLPLFSYAR